jgi:hypothetical protein
MKAALDQVVDERLALSIRTACALVDAAAPNPGKSNP